MKLKNKRTGEIIEWEKPISYKLGKEYGSLAELNDEWEDAPEEPKKYWYVSDNGYICTTTDAGDGWDKYRKEVGNYFLSKEKAEKAEKRWRAWTRLKDKGFDIEGWSTDIGDNYYKTGQIVLNLNNVKNRDWDEYDQIKEIKNDLDIIFRR